MKVSTLCGEVLLHLFCIWGGHMVGVLGFRTLLLAVSIFGYVAPTTAALAFVRSPFQILVVDDLGGAVEERMRQVDRMRAQGQGAAIPYGRCISACTLYLGLPDTCVGRSAVFGFHGPSARTRGLGLPLGEFDRVSHAMANYYPEPVRSWYLSTARHIIGTYYQVSGAQLISMGFRECT
jgi:hypothetical protein